MHNYLFRGKDIETGMWAYGYYFETGELSMISETTVSNNPELPHTHIVDPITVSPSIEMYTWGGDDPSENDRLIFVNDIVKIKTNFQDEDVFLIVHSHELPSFEVFRLSDIEFNGVDFYNHIAGRIDYTEFLLMLQDPWGDFRSVSVIGNLFDNRDIVIGALRLNGVGDEYINKLPTAGGSK